ncbi:hypothetical protein HPB50_013341 [Hyalomma asiaticum]|uniref:Uncharacterized protein n=1 Tax=Hyalomma asiaticum TaxID=266040 RepID=A0ACB7TFW4_HYAAI|nr:hypothetical protein HPB50_013341 [Hyalomma asiaticum]
MVGMQCGSDSEFFEALKTKLNSKTEFERHGMLLFDKILVRQQKTVHSKTLTYTGLVDFGEGDKRCSELANHALVFMFCPFSDNYAQPIGVFTSKGTTRATVLSQLVLQAIVMLENAGALVDGIVCDEAATNRKMWAHLGVSGKLDEARNFSEHPVNGERKVFAFSDVPHLFKCVRNRLLKQRLLKANGQWVKWTLYTAVHKEDCKNAGGLKVCPKITGVPYIPLQNGAYARQVGNTNLQPVDVFRYQVLC